MHPGRQRKMTEIIKLMRYKNYERLGRNSFSDRNDHRKSDSSINTPTCKFIASFSVCDVAMFGTFSCLLQTNFSFEPHLICCLQMISVWTSEFFSFGNLFHIDRKNAFKIELFTLASPILEQ